MDHQNKIIGRDPSCDFVILDPENRVSRKHLEAIKRNNVFYIKDLNSKNGTYLNGKIIPPNQEIEIRVTDLITLSKDYPFELKAVFEDESTRIFSVHDKIVFDNENMASIQLKDKTILFDMDKTTIGELSAIDADNFITIGRDPENLHIINRGEISRKHCRIKFISPLLIEIEDLNSTNGTYVDGEKLEPNAQILVTTRATIRLGKEYELDLPSILPQIQNLNKVVPPSLQEKNKNSDSGPREANISESAAFKELETIWKDYLSRHKTAQSKALGFTIGGSVLGIGAAVATAAVGPLGLVLMAGGGILGKYLGQLETSRIQNDLTFEDMFLVAYSCPRCKESFQKKPWITIRECFKCKLKFR